MGIKFTLFASVYDQHRLVGESCYRLMTKSGQFIYMRTCGQLDVDEDSRAVRSFVCTNTVVQEAEGKHLIKMMKKKFMLMINNTDEAPPEEESIEVNQNYLSTFASSKTRYATVVESLLVSI